MFSFLSRFTLGLAVVSVAVFFIWHLAKFFAPPTLTLHRPEGDVIVEDPAIEAVGEAARGARLTINEEVIYREPEDDRFSEVLPLKPGENVFVFRAEDRLGRVREVVRRVYRF